MNTATKNICSIYGILVGLGNINHGIFEVLQGYKPTGGVAIRAIGPEHIMWEYGGEEAITLIPNFMLTGIAAILAGLAIIVWSAYFLHTRRGPLVFLLLGLISILVGGGVAQLLFIILIWAVAGCIRKPLSGWEKRLPKAFRARVKNSWPFWISLTVIGFLCASFIAVTGYVPGLANAEVILYICWSFLGLSLLGFLFAMISAFSYDIAKRKASV